MMSSTTLMKEGISPHPEAWTGFKPGPWQTAIDVREFIQLNYAV